MKKAGLLLPAFAVVVVLAFSSLFIVDERENVLVLQFGQVRQEITETRTWVQGAVHSGSCAL